MKNYLFRTRMPAKWLKAWNAIRLGFKYMRPQGYAVFRTTWSHDEQKRELCGCGIGAWYLGHVSPATRKRIIKAGESGDQTRLDRYETAAYKAFRQEFGEGTDQSFYSAFDMLRTPAELERSGRLFVQQARQFRRTKKKELAREKLAQVLGAAANLAFRSGKPVRIEPSRATR